MSGDQLDLDAIEARAEAAAEGPWRPLSDGPTLPQHRGTLDERPGSTQRSRHPGDNGVAAADWIGVDMTDVTEFQATAKWTPDCGGKQDYDGRLISISTRYWPAWKSTDGRPSANAAIIVNHGTPHPEEEFADYSTIAEADFAADTETEVKAQVEAWVREACREILSGLGIAALPGDGAEVSR